MDETEYLEAAGKSRVAWVPQDIGQFGACQFGDLRK